MVQIAAPVTTPLWVLLEVQKASASDQGRAGTYYLLAVIGDTEVAWQGELLHKLRAVFQEHTDIAAVSERYYVVYIAISETRRLAA